MIFDDVLFVEAIREHGEEGIVPEETIRADIHVEDVTCGVASDGHSAAGGNKAMAFLGTTRGKVRETGDRRGEVSVDLSVVEVFGVRKPEEIAVGKKDAEFKGGFEGGIAAPCGNSGDLGLIMIFGSGIEAFLTGSVEVLKASNRVEGDRTHGQVTTGDSVAFLVDDFVGARERKREFGRISFVGVTL